MLCNQVSMTLNTVILFLMAWCTMRTFVFTAIHSWAMLNLIFKKTIYCVDRCCPLVALFFFLNGMVLFELTSDVMKQKVQSVYFNVISQIVENGVILSFEEIGKRCSLNVNAF